MIELSRLWEMNCKTMTAADDNSRQAASIAQLRLMTERWHGLDDVHRPWSQT
jgi:hypothetical protein